MASRLKWTTLFPTDSAGVGFRLRLRVSLLERLEGANQADAEDE